MAFALYLLAKNPEAQRKLQQEVDQVLKDNPETLTPAHVAKLSYTKAVVKESLRFVSLLSSHCQGSCQSRGRRLDQ